MTASLLRSSVDLLAPRPTESCRARRGRLRGPGQAGWRLGRGGHRVGGRAVRPALLRHQLHGRRRARRTWPPGSRPASTSSSSTPACTSRRPCRCATRSPRTMPVRVLSIQPVQTVGQQDGEHGPRLFDRDPDACCALRKVEPLERALADYDAWAAGIRRDESATRANAREVDFEPQPGQGQGRPARRLDRRRRRGLHRAVRRPGQRAARVRATGRSAAGRAPARSKPGEDPRAGRWAMFDKTECGLHR